MKYRFTLNEEDYLTHQLYLSSNSKKSMGRRKRSWFLTTSIFLGIGIIFHMEGNAFLGNYFFVAALLSLLFFPLYSRWRYKKHFRSHIAEHFSNLFGNPVTVEFLEDYIVTQDESESESKISTAQVVGLHELPKHFFVTLVSGQSLILPKEGIDQPEELRKDLETLGRKVGLDIIDRNDWKWR